MEFETNYFLRSVEGDRSKEVGIKWKEVTLANDIVMFDLFIVNGHGKSISFPEIDYLNPEIPKRVSMEEFKELRTKLRQILHPRLREIHVLHPTSFPH